MSPTFSFWFNTPLAFMPPPTIQVFSPFSSSALLSKTLTEVSTGPEPYIGSLLDPLSWDHTCGNGWRIADDELDVIMAELVPDEINVDANHKPRSTQHNVPLPTLHLTEACAAPSSISPNLKAPRDESTVTYPSPPATYDTLCSDTSTISQFAPSALETLYPEVTHPSSPPESCNPLEAGQPLKCDGRSVEDSANEKAPSPKHIPTAKVLASSVPTPSTSTVKSLPSPPVSPPSKRMKRLPATSSSPEKQCRTTSNMNREYRPIPSKPQRTHPTPSSPIIKHDVQSSPLQGGLLRRRAALQAEALLKQHRAYEADAPKTCNRSVGQKAKRGDTDDEDEDDDDDDDDGEYATPSALRTSKVRKIDSSPSSARAERDETSGAAHNLEKYCSLCKKRFGRPSDLVRHCETSTTHFALANSKAPAGSGALKTIRFPCVRCEADFSRKDALKRHRTSCH